MKTISDLYFFSDRKFLSGLRLEPKFNWSKAFNLSKKSISKHASRYLSRPHRDGYDRSPTFNLGLLIQWIRVMIVR